MKRNLLLAGAVAAMLASAASQALAQDATPAPAPAPMATPAPDATTAPPPAPMAPAAPDSTTAAPPAPMAPMAPAATDSTTTNPGTLSTGSMATPMMPGSIDFSVLSNKNFNYTDLKKAKAEGFSDTEVASIAKIADLTGETFPTITDRVLHGTTFSTLATEYMLPLPEVLNVSDEKDKIAAYETAYEATGSMALKSSSMDMPAAPMAPAASSASTMPMSSMPMAPTKDIVAIAMSDKRFSTLVKELKKADLVSALQGPGPFTVFAPTNAAFKKLPKGALKDLEKDPTKLAAVLKYHVLPARVDAATATSMTSPTSPPTLEGSTLQVTSSGGSVKINDATVTQADIMATNGIIHAIDTMLMPSDLPASTSTSGTASTGTTPDTTTATPSSTATGTTSTGTTGAPDSPNNSTSPVTPPAGAPTATPASPAQ